MIKIPKITNTVLAERIKFYHDDMMKEFIEVKKELDKVKNEVCENSDFRKQAKTTVGLVTIIASFVGGVVVFVMDKAWKVIGK